MKAIIYQKYGAPEVLQMVEIDKPSPKGHEILIKMKATTVNSGDCRLRKADPFFVRLVFGLIKPRQQLLGMTFAGEVEKVGENVTLFKEGDQVFGSTEMRMGAYAQYVCVSEDIALALKPVNWTFEAAASIPFGTHTARRFLKTAQVVPGQKVMIYGASGAVGVAAVQLAKYIGAEVTAVCSNSNIELVKSLGAYQVLDYNSVDFSTISEKWDVVFETVNKIPVGKIARLVKEGGVLILGAAIIKASIHGLWIAMTSKCRVITGTHTLTRTDMEKLRHLMESGVIQPVIDRVYPFEQMVEAHRYVDAGHKKGNVVVNIG
jgi:NADPH:quinone reductase-like Zn-dependent oxidoreductase